jgi:hypothetical protein
MSLGPQAPNYSSHRWQQDSCTSNRDKLFSIFHFTHEYLQNQPTYLSPHPLSAHTRPTSPPPKPWSLSPLTRAPPCPRSCPPPLGSVVHGRKEQRDVDLATKLGRFSVVDLVHQAREAPRSRPHLLQSSPSSTTTTTKRERLRGGGGARLELREVEATATRQAEAPRCRLLVSS